MEVELVGMLQDVAVAWPDLGLLQRARFVVRRVVFRRLRLGYCVVEEGG